MGFTGFISTLVCRLNRFSIAVQAVATRPGGQTLLSGKLRHGSRPQVGDMVRVVRTGATGMVEDVSVLGEDSAFRPLGVRVSFAVSDETMRTSIGLRISGIKIDKIQNGDVIVPC